MDKKTVLIVDDNIVNRKVLRKLLSPHYNVVEAENGEVALEIIEKKEDKMTAVMLDIVMPEMDGYAFLKYIREKKMLHNVPILVTSGNCDRKSEAKALELGAWDFISKPYDGEIIEFRLKNAIERSQLTAFQQLKYLSEYDVLTGIYNKRKFFERTEEMLAVHPNKVFAFVRFDVDRFQLVNSFFGVKEGDRLLSYIAEKLKGFSDVLQHYTYGRMEADVFCICIQADEKEIIELVKKARALLESYNPNYDIVPSFGIYMIRDRETSMDAIYDRANLASKKSKGSYIETYSFYDEAMRSRLIVEQQLINQMNVALSEKQFQVYLQPKYNLQTEHPEGGEVLVRWMHPEKGMIPPREFIPVFERNGFIMELDYYVWEMVCKQLKNWIDEGREPYPVSVNVSRVNLYNPKFADSMIELVEKHGVPPRLLNLELTESAYSDNPIIMREVTVKLQKHGFLIMMDDFGSGYSSLNILKDLPVDVLKIDMKFLSDTGVAGRGENILSSVIRMAKWLNIPVIAEGVETKEQADFLRSVGCSSAQGYYFAKPMPISEYEEYIAASKKKVSLSDEIEKKGNLHIDEFWTPNAQVNLLFNSIVNAVGIYEFDGEKLELIRANDGFFEITGDSRERFNSVSLDITNLIFEEDRIGVLQAFREAVGKETAVEYKYRRYRNNGDLMWLHIRIKHILSTDNRHLFYGAFNDITKQRGHLRKSVGTHKVYACKN